MKVALVHDHLAQYGGAERVLKVFQEIFPAAPTFVLVYNPEQSKGAFARRDIRTSFIQRLPWGLKRYQWYLPLMPLAVERYNLMDYDLVLSSTSSFAKGVITRPETLHVCYCHTPTRYLWSDTHSYVQELKYPRLVKKLILAGLPRIRQWDRLAADRVDRFIANSQNVARRIKKYYRRDSVVIHPPIELEQFILSPVIDRYFLAGGRLVAYKRFDIIVKAFSKLGIPLKIFGVGPELLNLKAQAKNNIEFLGKVSDQERQKLFSHCQAFIHPQEEDFGLVMLEAMASGRPVIAYAKGGALEIMQTPLTGVFFEEQTWEDLADQVLRFKAEAYDPQQIRAYAQNFSVASFKQKIKAYIETEWVKYQQQNK